MARRGVRLAESAVRGEMSRNHPESSRVALAWATHLYTALSAIVALLALLAAVEGDYRAAFLWLALATAIDATDGWLARRVRVREATPAVDGARLDDIVDYLTFVFVPAVLVVHAQLVPPALGVPTAAAMLLASAYGFSQVEAKAGGVFFTGFPSYWNIVVFYLYAWGPPGWFNAVLLAFLAVMVFVPLRYVYPTRTPVLRGLTLAAGVAWGAAVFYLMWRLPEAPRWLLGLSLTYPAYYIALSFVLHWRTHRRADAGA